jgi:hypothetical protein
MMKPLRALVLTSALAFGAIGTASAGNSGSGPSLPACLGGNYAGDACLLPLKNGDFTAPALSAWKVVGLPSRGGDADGNTYAALPTGSGIKQAVYAHTGQNTAEAVYTLRFQVRAEHTQSQVRATLAMSTADGMARVPLGYVTSTAVANEWTTVELSVQGRPYAAPAHVLVEIDSEGGTPTTVQVADVALVESTGVEVLTR